MGLSRTVTETNGDFSHKSQIFSTFSVFCAPLNGFPLELGISAMKQDNRMMVLSGRERSLPISSAVWIQYTNVTNGRTDRHRATAKSALTHDSLSFFYSRLISKRCYVGTVAFAIFIARALDRSGDGMTSFSGARACVGYNGHLK